jgi:hypothetical protein
MKLPALAHEYLRRPYRVLFCSLVITLIAAPVAAEYQLKTWPIELLLVVNLAVASLGYGTVRGRRVLLGIVILTALLRISERWFRIEAASTGATVLTILVAVIAAANALRFALRGRQVDSERLSAALSAYLLAGHFFGIACFQIEQMRPGSYAIAGVAAQPAQLDLQTAIYFSFVTLVTLGYGDISPLTPTARGLAITEALLGQLYLAVLISRLVGMAGSKEDVE